MQCIAKTRLKFEARLCIQLPSLAHAMATFSPSPAPRRSSRLNNRGVSPAISQWNNRFAPAATVIVDSGSVASAMDIDDRASIMTDRSLSKLGGDVIFAKTEEMSVSFYANLPLEVKQVLRTAGRYTFNMTVPAMLIYFEKTSVGSITQEKLIL